MAGYLLGGAVAGYILGIATMIGAIIFYNKKLKSKVDEIKLRNELYNIDKEVHK